MGRNGHLVQEWSGRKPFVQNSHQAWQLTTRLSIRTHWPNAFHLNSPWIWEGCCLWRIHFSTSTREVISLPVWLQKHQERGFCLRKISPEAGNRENFQVPSQSEAVQVNCFLCRSQPASIRQDEQRQGAGLAGPGSTAVALDLLSPLKKQRHQVYGCAHEQEGPAKKASRT